MVTALQHEHILISENIDIPRIARFVLDSDIGGFDRWHDEIKLRRRPAQLDTIKELEDFVHDKADMFFNDWDHFDLLIARLRGDKQ